MNFVLFCAGDIIYSSVCVCVWVIVETFEYLPQILHTVTKQVKTELTIQQIFGVESDLPRCQCELRRKNCDHQWMNKRDRLEGSRSMGKLLLVCLCLWMLLCQQHTGCIGNEEFLVNTSCCDQATTIWSNACTIQHK